MNDQGNNAGKNEQIQVECFTLGPFETNCYVITTGNSAGGAGQTHPDCWIVDASFEPAPIIDFIAKHKLHPTALILTHAHVDHIAGATELVAAFSNHTTHSPLPVWVHEAEAVWLNDPVLNLSALGGIAVTSPGPDRILMGGETLQLGSETPWDVLHTPGHSPGGITLYNPGAGLALVGDTLFAGSVGRSDFPGSDQGTLFESIRTKLYTLPEATRIYPGHGPASTIGRERKHNPYVRG
ncbi:MAG: MBL fold metallo-hydrolase [Pyrinomonadaceae bacterium]|nr:MBL fold metallo-hydrolase [Phycisphaerales bacterium]